MPEKINPIRKTDDEARLLARNLVEDASYAALAVNAGREGYPLASRIAVAFSPPTGLFFSASDLSTHSKCLVKDTRCSLLLGEVGKGDGLAHPRITIVGTARRMAQGDSAHSTMREIFLTGHPKARLYVDFSDFRFYRMDCRFGLLNGGFGMAFHLDVDDLVFLNQHATG